MSGSGPTVFGFLKRRGCHKRKRKSYLKNITKFMLLEVVKEELKSMDNLTKLNLDKYKPLRDVVFENLREAIVEGN